MKSFKCLKYINVLKTIIPHKKKKKNVSLSHETYNILDQIRKVLVPNTTLSRSQTINVLVKEKAGKLNGRIRTSGK